MLCLGSASYEPLNIVGFPSPGPKATVGSGENQMSHGPLRLHTTQPISGRIVAQDFREICEGHVGGCPHSVSLSIPEPPLHKG